MCSAGVKWAGLETECAPAPLTSRAIQFYSYPTDGVLQQTECVLNLRLSAGLE